MKDNYPPEVLVDALQSFAHIEGVLKTVDELLAEKAWKDEDDVFIPSMPSHQKEVMKSILRKSRHYNLRVLYPATLCSSLFLTTYSLLEHSLDELAKSIAVELKSTISLSDLNHRGIKRSRIYLEKIAMVNLPSDPKVWQRLDEANSIRNCLAHTGGRIESFEKGKEIKKIISKDNSLVVVEGYLVLRRQYVLNFTELVTSIVQDILKLNYERMPT